MTTVKRPEYPATTRIDCGSSVVFSLAVVLAIGMALIAYLFAPERAPGQSTVPVTVQFPSPSAPPIVAGQFVTVSNGHLSLNGQRFVAFGSNLDTWAILTP